MVIVMIERFPFHLYAEYNPNSGEVFLTEEGFKLRISIQSRPGKKGYSSYLRMRICWRILEPSNQEVYIHRLAWKLYYGSYPKGMIDHIDGNGLNNRIDNLRDVSSRDNMRNKAMYKKNKSGITGVRYEKGTGKKLWAASIGNRNIGRFESFLDACCARLSAEAKEDGYTDGHGLRR